MGFISSGRAANVNKAVAADSRRGVAIDSGRALRRLEGRMANDHAAAAQAVECGP
jgi:hypothetical protein